MSEIVTHVELLNPFFPLNDSSGVRPKLAGAVTLRSVLSGDRLSIYTIAPISRLDSNDKRIGDIRIHEIDYHYEAADYLNPDNETDRRELAEEIRFTLSLAGNNGDWESGAENVRATLESYGDAEITNRIEFERLISDARKFLGDK